MLVAPASRKNRKEWSERIRPHGVGLFIGRITAETERGRA
jgi:hypothetical protein